MEIRVCLVDAVIALAAIGGDKREALCGNILKHVDLRVRKRLVKTKQRPLQFESQKRGRCAARGVRSGPDSSLVTGVGPRGSLAVGLTSRPKRRPGSSHRGSTCAQQQVDACHAASASTLSACPAAAARDCGFECGVVVVGRHRGSVGAAAPLSLGSDHAARCLGGRYSSSFG